MDRQAAYDLFASLLKRRGVKGLDLDKDLPSLLRHAASYGFFANPHAVHELAEWRKYGDKLWELVLDDDKSAKKMSKFWKIVQNELLKCEAEKQAVVAAKEAQGKNKIYYGHPSDPNPPRVAFVDLPPPQPPPTAPPLPSNADPLSPTPPDPPATEPFPGALSDLAEAMAQGRRETWAALAQQGWQREDPDLAAAAQEQIDTCAFPVIFQPNPQGGQRAELVNLDWKLLSQLRATVASYGVTSEPAKQMLEFLFNANLLLPSDIRGISKLIYTPHQRLLFEARWREEAAMSAALPRPQGDPLTGLTMDELMGQGPFHRIEAQVALGQEKLREAMAVARRAMGKIRAPGGTPIYMGIKQGRDEPLGSFVDKIIEALSKAGPCIFQCIQRMMMSMVENVKMSMFAIKENGGSVESLSEQWLAEKGHDMIKLVEQPLYYLEAKNRQLVFIASSCSTPEKEEASLILISNMVRRFYSTLQLAKWKTTEYWA
ncbi:hypothetical protein DUI87_12692 [Hirundo rustica rustica]|uniref:Uncharacterized protein n=1 Tax=Hirundo rustica rustica TaxID=333673 RepID=A0A3M0K9X4_HIRRU|nr:hypothetical protein DUI87_12692 [Hirundo rustica rustica]